MKKYILNIPNGRATMQEAAQVRLAVAHFMQSRNDKVLVLNGDITMKVIETENKHIRKVTKKARWA